MANKKITIENTPLDRLSNNLRNALRVASQISKDLGNEEVSPEHLFISIVLNDKYLATKTILEMGIDRGELIKKSFGGNIIDISNSNIGIKEIILSEETKEVLRRAYEWAQKFSHVYVGTEHVILALLQSKDPYFVDLKNIGLDIKTFRKSLSKYATYPVGILAKVDMPNVPVGNESIVDSLGVDLVELAEKGKLDPVIGRDEEIEQMINVLSRRKKNNPIIVGDAGVGKTVLVEGLAQKIASGKVPPSLRDIRIISLDVASIIAGSKMRGDVEEKVMAIIDDIIYSNNKILFIDEIHNIITPGSQSEIANVLKPALLEDGFRCIGATTSEEYTSYFEPDNALARRFQPIFLEECTVDDAIEILKNIKPILENHHKIGISQDAILSAAMLSDRYVSDRYLPDKAIDLLDEAVASKRLSVESKYTRLSKLIYDLERLTSLKEMQILKGNMQKAEELQKDEIKFEKKISKLEKKCELDKSKKENDVTAEDVRKIVSKWTGIPLNSLGNKERTALLKLDSVLEDSVVGQHEAVESVASAIKRARAGISNKERPWASFLFLGPTGVGKSELAKALTKTLFGSEDRLIQIDMSEMMEMHSVSKLIGSPPGYVGFQQGGWLTEKVRRNPHSVILFDEIEKAHPDVLNVLLQILEYGHLTDGKGRRVNFKNTIVILTSNIGAEEIRQDKVLGFVGKESRSLTDEEIENAYGAMEEMLLSELKNTLRPELLNRLDDIVIFRSLNRKDAKKIVKILLSELNDRLKSQKIQIKLDTRVVNYLVKEGFSNEYGARPLRRMLQDRVENVVAEYLLENPELKSDVVIELGLDGSEIVIIN
jgi:ATP-dependent Clp protease ATP-binding subunit ClpC